MNARARTSYHALRTTPGVPRDVLRPLTPAWLWGETEGMV
jgi:hypothetical protein